MNIKIIVEDDNGSVIARSEHNSTFEMAEMEMGKIERFVEKQAQAVEQDREDEAEESVKSEREWTLREY